MHHINDALSWTISLLPLCPISMWVLVHVLGEGSIYSILEEVDWLCWLCKNLLASGVHYLNNRAHDWVFVYCINEMKPWSQVPWLKNMTAYCNEKSTQTPAENGTLLLLTFISQSVYLFLHAGKLAHITLSSLCEVLKDFERVFNWYLFLE